MFKKSIRKISLVLSAVMLICMILVPMNTVSAIGKKSGSIKVGSASTITCKAGEVRYLGVKVTKTGFYKLDVTNNSGDGRCTVAIFDDATDTEVAYWYNSIDGTKTIDKIFLAANKSYTLTLGRFGKNDKAVKSSFTVKLEKYNFNPAAIDKNDKNFSFSDTETRWFTYTPGVTADYAFRTNGFTGFVDVYDATTGKHVYKRADTEWYDYTKKYDSYQDKEVEIGWTQRIAIIFNLKANTKYYFLVSNYDAENKNPKISITQNSKTVSKIETVKPTGKFSPLTVINESVFNYKLTYTDKTTATGDYITLCKNGYTPPKIEFLGRYLQLEDYNILRAVKSPVASTYNGKRNVFYINIASYTDGLVASNTDAVNETYRCYIEKGKTDGVFRLKVKQTGYYSWTDFYSNEKIGKILKDYSAYIIDEQNNFVKYDEKKRAWPLVGGREYAFIVFYEFNSAQSKTSYSFKFIKNTAKTYPDVEKNAWYSDAITYVSGRGIMSGYQNGKFGTSDGIQRQDFLVMLARLDGVDLPSYKLAKGKFPDVKRGSYYEAAVAWGAENGIVTGYDNGKFGVGDKITREQIVTFLYRYADYKEADMSGASKSSQLSKKYKDYKKVSTFAKEPIAWAIGKGVMSGKTTKTIVPQGKAQRCEVAKIMYNIFLKDVF